MRFDIGNGLILSTSLYKHRYIKKIILHCEIPVQYVYITEYPPDITIVSDNNNWYFESVSFNIYDIIGFYKKLCIITRD